MTSKTNRVSPPRILLHAASVEGASAIYRMAAPADALRRTGYAATLVIHRLQTPEIIKALNPDTVIIQHFYTDPGIEAAKVYRKQKGLHVVFEIDDLFWEMDAENINTRNIPTDVLARLRRTVAEADVAVVSTPVLADQVHKALGLPHNRIKIVRNCLPQAFVTTALAARDKRAPRKSDKPRVGWAGSVSHDVDLAILSDVIKATAHKIQWVFMGYMPPGVPGDLVEFHNAVPYSQYSTKLALLDLDLAVAPLADTVFNSCKSDLRILEFAACGYPILASNVPAFGDVPDSLFRVAGDWENAIWEALEAKSNAQSLHDWVKANRILESQTNLDRWSWAWSPDDKVPFRPSVLTASPEAPVIVGEPVDYFGLPTYRSIQNAVHDHPTAPIVCIRPGCVPTAEQVALLIDEGEKNTHLTLSALTNDGDYPAPGRFMPLAGTPMRDLAEAALNLIPEDAKPVQIGYAGGPLMYLSAKALAAVGLPDEDRYGGDIETAVLDWCMRLQDMGCPGHVALPQLFVPVYGPGRIGVDEQFAKTAISEISTWHTSLPALKEQLHGTDPFAVARTAIERAYVNISYETPACADYAEWSAMHDAITPAVNEWATEVAKLETKISVVMPVYNAPPAMLQAAVDSVINQLYPHWELIIVDDASTDQATLDVLNKVDHENITKVYRVINGHISEASNSGLNICTADWVTFLDHDDALTPYSLAAMAEAIQQHPDVQMFYADSDLLDAEGKLQGPFFKPDFDYDLFLAQNYICHPTVYRRKGLTEIGGFLSEYDGSQDYDLTLRYIEKRCWKETHPDRSLIHHIPLVLYHWRQSPNSVSTNMANKPYAAKAAHQAVFDHLKRTGRNVFVGPNPRMPIHHLIRFIPTEPLPKVAIVILTQTDRKRIDTCLNSIFKHTLYGNYQVVIRQVGEDPGISEALKQQAKRNPRLTWTKGGGDKPFNFALLNNTVVRQTALDDVDVIVFLNDDTEIIEGSWLNDMVGIAMREDIGAVGVKLIYPNGNIQHNGVTIGYEAPPGEFALHLHQRAHHTDIGPHGATTLAHQSVAVTAACMAIQRKRFLSIGGFDAEHFPLDYNDVDLCLRLYEAGYSNVVLSHICVVHLEGATKRTKPLQVTRAGTFEAEATVKELHYDLLPVDPYSNANRDHHPAGNVVKNLPIRPWRQSLTPSRSLVIGCDKADAHNLFIAGELSLRAIGDGPYLRLEEPFCEHGGIVDMRDHTGFCRLLFDLNVRHIILRQMGGGSPETILGALQHAAETMDVRLDYWAKNFESVCPRLDCTNSEGACGHKWKEGIEGCQACIDRDGSPYGFVSVLSYRAAWGRFSEFISKQETDRVAA